MKGDPQLEPIDEMKPTDADPLLEKPTVSDQSVPESSTNEITNDGGDDEEIDASSAACCRICLEYNGEPDEDLISPCMCKGTQQFVHRSCLDHWRSVKEGFAFSHCTTCKAQFHLRVESLEDNSWQKLKFRIFVARDVLLVFLAVQTAIAAMGGFAYFMDKNEKFRNSFSDGWDRILSKHPIPFYYCVAEKGPMILILTYHILGGLACDVAIPLSSIRETHSPPKDDDDVISLNKLITKMLQIGVLAFFVVLGFFGLILHCSSLNNNDPCAAGCRNCCYGWGILDCFPASMEACFALLIVFIIIFAILGIAYGFLAATMAIQRIWQRHYHVLTKRELTKEYVVEDLQGCYTLPKLDPEHEERLKMLKLL